MQNEQKRSAAQEEIQVLPNEVKHKYTKDVGISAKVN